MLLSYFLLSTRICISTIVVQAINFKHGGGGGGGSCCWDIFAFLSTKARPPCFNVKVMHIVQ